MGIYSFPRLVSAHFLMLFIAHVYSLNSDESSALLALKAYISPESPNVLANNWTTATSVCNWIGVICGGQPRRVVALNLSSMGLDGTLPPIGTTPSALGSITSLKTIDLSYNKLSGSIDSTIFNLSSLQIIDLSHNRLDGNLPADMGNRLPELKELYLSWNQLYGEIPSSLFNCRQLKELSLSSNSFTGNISINLGNLTMLKDLDLSTNYFEGRIPSSIGNCSSLKTINFRDNNLEGAIPSEVGLFLPNLLELQLRGNKLQGTIPSSIANASKLTLLDLADNSFTGPIPMKIGDLKALVEIDLSINQLSGHIPDSIVDLKNLAYLSLAVNILQGPIPQFLGLSVALEFLDLSRNNLSGVIPKSLENLRYLIYFNVSFNQLEGEIPGGGSFANFTAQSYLMNKALCGAARLQVRHCRTGKRSWKTLLKKILLPEIASICILSLIYRVIKHCLEKEKDPLLKTNRTVLYQEIVLATDGFSESNLLGTGSSGSVYKGTMKEEKNVAIKVFNLNPERGLRSFQVESNLLTKVEVASAMSYLHSEHIIHCDLKPSNVLLDEDMVARVSDFSIAKLLDGRDAAVQTGTMATIGYMSPEYGLRGIVSEKTDVYSFGILLMETFTGKKPTNDIFNEEMNLRRWIFESLPHAVDRIIDVTLLQRDQEEVAAKARCIKSIMELACFCTADSFSERKTMAEVDIELHRIKSHFLTDAKLIEEIQRALHPGILFGEFEVAVDGFSEINLLYSGKSNSVFRGSWKDHVVAIKNFNLQKRGLKSFEVHCQALSFIRHRNIVRVLGYCSDDEFNALLVEYMPNGSLQNYLHPGMNIFNFHQRLDIMINVASALSYLHSMRVIHCNLNPTNVLLDEDMVARISGFSFAKFLDKGSAATRTTTMAETPGYIAPEYESTGNVSEKTDVYSFGILLMETFTILRPTEEMNWKSRICDSLQSEDKIAGLDFQQTDQEGFTATATPTKRFLRTILRLIYCCTSELPDERKCMWEVETELVRLKQQFWYSVDGNIYRDRACGGNEMQELD
ncbi:hypothetical protein PVK06_037478 [Gossypium arboreum]|uniref:Protein kinase domain-containing protein n=1 Tax=Gossypium arboreum TaxID=29729 RepID=A0ABR0MXU9_GOSAR|nr:hypothetical protein PVK06_037478 [Gossypium arboreum]